MEEYTLGDIDRWTTMFPLAEVPHRYQRGTTVIGPADLALIEQLRRRAASIHDLGRSTATDVFVFAEGEPARRDVTKVAGQPYRPSGKPWPASRDGVPMTFLAQFRFTESQDLVGKLPGDVLLIFVQDEEALFDPEVEACLFEWYPLGIKDLATEREQPKTSWELPICYGVRYRTVDYVDDYAAERIAVTLPDEITADITHKDSDRPHVINYLAGSLAQIEGIKIGGAPFWVEPSGDMLPDVDIPGKFLCSLSGIVPSPSGRYPWVNHPEPQSDRELKETPWLVIMGHFVINLFLDDENRTHWRFQAGG